MALGPQQVLGLVEKVLVLAESVMVMVLRWELVRVVLAKESERLAVVVKEAAMEEASRGEVAKQGVATGWRQVNFVVVEWLDLLMVQQQ